MSRYLSAFPLMRSPSDPELALQKLKERLDGGYAVDFQASRS